MTAMRSSDDILEQAARDGSIDISEWPRVLENVLQKLHDIVHNDFPLPQIPPSAAPAAPAVQATEAAPTAIDPAVVAASPPPSHPQSSDAAVPSTDSDPPVASEEPVSDPEPESALPLSQSSVTTNKENAPPPRPPVPSFSSNPTAPAASSTHQTPISDSPLPPDLLGSYQSSTNILRHTFAHSPPYTIQRLAELVLQPRRHYRFLPPFLSALDRAVSVTSPVDSFPLTQLQVTGSVGFLTNGEAVNGAGERGGLGSDESLGGALLTPIPWMKRHDDDALAAHTNGDSAGNQELRVDDEETIDGPYGAGRIETVSVTTSSPSSVTPQPSTPTGNGEGGEAAAAHEQELRAQGAVTQGELLRQEQTAGVVPYGQETPRHPNLIAGGAVAVGRETAAVRAEAADSAAGLDEGQKPTEDRPHARGPDVIGMEDTGPQTSPAGESRPLDMEAAAGRKSPVSTSPSVEESQQHSIANVTEKKDGDPLIVDGNKGGAAESAVAGEKRKRSGDDGDGEEKKEEKKLEAEETEEAKKEEGGGGEAKPDEKQENEEKDQEMADAPF